MSRCQAARTCYQECQCSLGFVCVPVAFKHGASDGFAFINLLSFHQIIFYLQRYNLSMCAFKVLSSCPRDVSYRRQAAEHDIWMRKWETPLPCGLPSTGFLPLTGLLERHFLRAHHPHTDADPASHRVCLWRGGSASKVLLRVSSLEFVFTVTLKYVIAPGSSYGAEGDGGTGPLAVTGPSVTQCLVCLLPLRYCFSSERCL